MPLLIYASERKGSISIAFVKSFTASIFLFKAPFATPLFDKASA